MNDMVNSPKHYTEGHIETIYAIEKALGPEGFKAYCMGNWIKYSSRHKEKGGAEDLAKAEVYLGWAVNGLPVPVNGKLPVKQALDKHSHAWGTYRKGGLLQHVSGRPTVEIAYFDIDNGVVVSFDGVGSEYRIAFAAIREKLWIDPKKHTNSFGPGGKSCS